MERERAENEQKKGAILKSRKLVANVLLISISCEVALSLWQLLSEI